MANIGRCHPPREQKITTINSQVTLLQSFSLPYINISKCIGLKFTSESMIRRLKLNI